MKKSALLFAAALLPAYLNAQVIIADNYNVTGTGTGFALNAGVNSGINPSPTRLTGSAATNLRYIPTAVPAKVDTAFSITSNKLRVTPATNPGRFTFSANGTTPFDFAPSLGTASATPQNPKIYDLTISMANSSTGILRCSFALATAEGDATTWDFGIQIYRTFASHNFYTIAKRIDIAASGLAADINSFITNSAAGTFGTELTFLMRVTDAGSETTTYNSRVQLSLDGGLTWIYDTKTDSSLPNGWRLNGAGRYILWDVAPDAGNVTYDNFSLRAVPLATTLLSPNANAQGLGASPNLIAAVSNTAPTNVTVTFYGHEAAKPGVGADFLIPVLPDTQNYAREASSSGAATKEMWFAQTDWILEHRVPDNIPFVATLGDCVNNADVLTQWRNATNAMYRLERPSDSLLLEGIPYGVTVGNHDQDPNGDLDGSTAFYNQYFGTPHFSNKTYYGGHFQTNNDTWFMLFSAGNMDFIVLSFEYGRYGATVLDWANDVLATNLNRRVIVLTHHAGDDTPDDTTTAPFSTQGSALYNGLKANTNFFLMLGGHVFNEGGEGRRSDTFNGKTVRTLISDYQGRFNGGNGLMRLMYFSPSNNTVSVKTFSPYTGIFETDANSQFSFSYNMQPTGAGSPGTPYVALATNLNVAPGAQSTFAWSGLQPNKTFEWYVKVTDPSGYSVFSSIRKFSTGPNSPPIATNQTITVTGDQATPLTLIAYDPNGDALTFRTNSLPLRGLNTNFNPTNGTITYLPAHGYRGLDRFHYQANDTVFDSANAMLTLNVVAPIDTNTNGLPDAWEAAYGVTDPNGDADGDGQNNLAEYSAGTNPTNAASALRILDASIQPGGDYLLSWSAVGGTRYRVQYSDGLSNGVENTFTDILRFIDTEMDSHPYGSASTQYFTDTFTNISTRYYRIKVVP